MDSTDHRAFFISRNGERKWVQDVEDFRPRYNFPVLERISVVYAAADDDLVPLKITSYGRVYEREVDGMPVYWEGWDGRRQTISRG